MNDERNLERRLRRKLYAAGCMLHKSRVRNINLDNFGGYMIVDYYTGGVVAGSRYELSLADVEAWASDLD